MLIPKGPTRSAANRRLVHGSSHAPPRANASITPLALKHGEHGRRIPVRVERLDLALVIHLDDIDAFECDRPTVFGRELDGPPKGCAVAGDEDLIRSRLNTFGFSQGRAGIGVR